MHSVELRNFTRKALDPILGVLVLVPAMLSAASPGFTVRYDIIDLGALGGIGSVALGINNKGQIVGSADISSGLRRAFLWENGVMQNLGTIPGESQSEAHDINENTQVVGIATDTGNISSAFIWQNGQITELGDPAQAKNAFAINDAGQVVGAAIFPGPNGGQHAMLLENGVLTDLTVAGFCSGIALDINTQGDVVGGPCIWQDGANVDLTLLAGGGGGALSINDHGQAAGRSNRADGTAVPVRWDDGHLTDLGLIVDSLAAFVFSSAEGINNKGQIVGAGTVQFGVAAGAFTEGFLFDPIQGAMLLKDTLPPNNNWSELSPRDINDNGWIVGAGSIGARRAFLMTPLPPIPATSPTLLAILTAAILIAAYVVLTKRARGLPCA